MSERELAASVVAKALEDALTPTEMLHRQVIRKLAQPKTLKSGKVVTQEKAGINTAAPTLLERTEAIRFLVDPSPYWRRSLDAWCDAAGVLPSAVVAKALALIPRESLPGDLQRLHEPHKQAA